MVRNLLLLCLLMTGCAGDLRAPMPGASQEELQAFETECAEYVPDFQPNNAVKRFPVNVLISTTNTDGDIELLLQAMDLWNSAIGHEAFFATITSDLSRHDECGYATVSTDAVQQSKESDNWVGMTTYNSCFNTVQVETMNTRASTNDVSQFTTLMVRQIATHEFGHVLGLGHESLNTSVMNAYVGNSIQYITAKSQCLARYAYYTRYDRLFGVIK